MNDPYSIGLITSKLWKKLSNYDINNLLAELGLNSSTLHPSTATYLNNMPGLDMMINGIRFFCPDSILLENQELMPGCFLLPHGYLAIASLASGDVFVIDIDQAEILLIDSDRLDPDGTINQGWNTAFSEILPNLPLTKENIVTSAQLRCGSVLQFLKNVSGLANEQM